MPGLLLVFLLATFANRVAESTWVLFTSYRFGWNGKEIGFSLAMVGVMFVVGQGGLVRIIVPALGERRAILLGLSVSVVVVLSYCFATEGWMVYPAIGLGIFGWTTAQPAVMSLMSRAIPPNEQGPAAGRGGQHQQPDDRARAAVLDQPVRLLREPAGADDRPRRRLHRLGDGLRAGLADGLADAVAQTCRSHSLTIVQARAEARPMP